MIRWHEGTKRVLVSSLKLPGDIQERQERLKKDAERVQRLRQVGIINLPVVDVSTMRVVAGRDRIALWLLEGQREVEVRLVDGSREELKRIELTENLDRRRSDDLVKMRLDWIRTMEKEPATARTDGDHQTSARRSHDDGWGEEPEQRDESELLDSVHNNSDAAPEPEPEPAPRRRGRPRSEAKAKREKAAKDLGVSEATVRRAVKKAAPEEAPAEAAPEPYAPRREVIALATHGLEIPTTIADSATQAQRAINVADQALKQAQAALTKARAHIPGHTFQQLKERLHEAAVDVRRALPAALCPYCDAGEKRPKCTACHGLGHVSIAAYEATPAKLKSPRKVGNIPVTVLDDEGRDVPVSDDDIPF